MLPGYGLHERFEIVPTKGGSEIQVTHIAKWWFLTCFTMHYEVRPKREREPAKVQAFVEALRSPTPPRPGPLRALSRRSPRTDDAPR